MIIKKHLKIIVVFVIISVIVLANATIGYAQNGFQKSAYKNFIPSVKNEEVTLIVEVEGEPLAIQSSLSAYSAALTTKSTSKILKNQQKVFSRIQSTVDLTVEKGFVYTSVFNGFTVDTTIDKLDEIKAVDGVKNVYIAKDLKVNTIKNDNTLMPLLDNAGTITGADYAYDFGYKGEGSVIAIIDIGFDTSHDFFKSEPINPRYTKDDIDELLQTLPLNSGVKSSNQVYKNAKIPYAYNYTENSSDTYIQNQSHGTRVAGIAAGKNGITHEGIVFSGVAPEAQLLALSCATSNGYIDMEVSLAAINDAVLLGADVINMSFGVNYADVLYEEFYRQIFENCLNAGVALVGGSGNEWRGFNNITPYTDMPDYGTIGAPASTSMVTAVASVNNLSYKFKTTELEAYDGTVFYAYPAHDNDDIYNLFSTYEGGTYIEYVDCGLGYSEQIGDVSGKLALVKRGELSFAEKVENAKNAGAVGILIYNNTDGIFKPAEIGFPCAVFTLEQGNLLLNQVDKSLRFNASYLKNENNTDAGLISDYSSWGITSSLDIKPDISAPGRDIYSSVPDNQYASSDGTSMATPYISGITALARQYYKTNPYLSQYNKKTGKDLVELIENIMMNSAKVARQTNGVPYSPRVQGAGTVDAEGILNTQVLIKGDKGKSKISLGDDLSDTLNIEFDITNIGENAIVFDKISAQVLTDGYVKSGNKFYVDKSVEVPVISVDMPEYIEVQSSQTQSFTAELKLDIEFLQKNAEIFTNGFYLEGYVFLENTSNSSKNVSIPFMGFYGDWGKAPVFDNTIYNTDGQYFNSNVLDGELGTYLATEFEWGTYPLGINPIFDMPAQEKYIAYSVYSQSPLGFVLTSFRAYENPVITVTDARGNDIIITEYEGMLAKYYTDALYIDYEQLENLSEGNYIISIKAKTAGPTETTDEISVPFTVDNSYPDIISAEYDENNKTITVKAKDNHYFSAFYIGYPYNGDYEYDYYEVLDSDYTNDGTVTKVIDASRAENIYDAEIGCIDYAFNEVYYKMDYFMHNIGVEIINIEQLNNMTLAEFNVQNNTGDDLSANFIIAFYDEGNNLIATNINNFALGAGLEDEISFSFFENTQNASYIKLFVWDIDVLKPLDVFKQFALY